MKFFKIVLFGLSFIMVSRSYSQDNSPWKSLSTKSVSGVVVVTGRHEYSLVGGQGFSVYLRNGTTQAVEVTGEVIAKTVCGKLVKTKFNTVLVSGQESSGGNFTDNGNSQTGVVTPLDCKGTKVLGGHVNRIKDVIVKDLVVKITGESVAAPKGKVIQKVPQTLSAKQIAEDSLNKLREEWGHTKDSLIGEITTLQSQKKSIQDSLAAQKKLLALKDSIQLKKALNKSKFSLDIQPAIGWEHLPLIVNKDSALVATTSASSHPLVQLGATVGLFNHSLVSAEVNPFVSYALNNGSNISGNHTALGANLHLFLNLHRSPIKPFIGGSFINRSGKWEQNKAGDDYQKADYNYNLYRVGAGFKYLLKDTISWIKPGLFLDQTDKASAIVGNLQVKIKKYVIIDLSYSTGYPTIGTNRYDTPSTFTAKSQDYYAVKLIFNIKAL